MIELIGISKRFNDKVVIDCAHLKIKDGEFVYILGESGAGKSTLLNILALFDTPSDGKYILDSHDITNFKNEYHIIRNQQFGFVFQAYNLLEEITAYENIALPLLYAKQRKIKEKKIFEIANDLGLSLLLNQKVNHMSGGEKQRIAFARAIVNDPQYVFCDEPTGNLDRMNSKTIIQLLHKENKKGKTIIVVTHDVNLIKKDSGVVYEIRNGKINKIS